MTLTGHLKHSDTHLLPTLWKIFFLLFYQQTPLISLFIPHKTFQLWLSSASQCTWRCLSSNMRTRTWFCCWMTAGPHQLQTHMARKDGAFLLKGEHTGGSFSWKNLGWFDPNHCVQSRCPFTGDSHRTTVLTVVSSKELIYPSLHKWFVVKLFSFVKPPTFENQVHLRTKLLSFLVFF